MLKSGVSHIKMAIEHRRPFMGYAIGWKADIGFLCAGRGKSGYRLPSFCTENPCGLIPFVAS